MVTFRLIFYFRPVTALLGGDGLLEIFFTIAAALNLFIYLMALYFALLCSYSLLKIVEIFCPITEGMLYRLFCFFLDVVAAGSAVFRSLSACKVLRLPLRVMAPSSLPAPKTILSGVLPSP